MPRNELSAFNRTRIIALWQEGLSRHQIAHRLNIVSRTINRYQETDGVQSRPRSRHPRVSTVRQDRFNAQSARNVLFTDETRIGLVSDDYRVRVWREPRRRNRLATAIRIAPYRGGSYNV